MLVPAAFEIQPDGRSFLHFVMWIYLKRQFSLMAGEVMTFQMRRALFTLFVNNIVPRVNFTFYFHIFPLLTVAVDVSIQTEIN